MSQDLFSPDWFREKLSASTDLRSVDVSEIGAAVGMTSHVYRATIDPGDAVLPGGDPVPESVIVKIPNEDVREMSDRFGIYEREARFYHDIAPSMKSGVPRCYYAEVAGGGVIILEDAPAGSTTLSDECTLAQATSTLTAVARLHAQYWKDPKLDQFKWAQRGDVQFYASMRDVLRTLAEALEAELQVTVNDRGRRALAALTSQYDMVVKTMCGRGRNTMFHGDLRLGNLLFSDSDDVYMIDWQTTGIAPGGADVGYLFSSSLAPELREAHFDELLDGYLHQLEMFGVTDYTKAQLIDDARGGVLMSVCHAVISRSSATGRIEASGIAAHDAWIQRAFSSLEHFEADVLLTL